ncbi:putative guanine nucleotide-binding protein alpha-1 subunit [Cunninghamella echinulata]|nr:putative guanine nucleotide-binding protein alpha-1 subunit [Cunninghamella echinulata]
MGCCISTTTSYSTEHLRNEEIEEQLKNEKVATKTIKLLLLGKSTFLKQIRLIHDGGFSKEERLTFRDIIVKNTLQSMITLLEAIDYLDLPTTDIQENRQELIHTLQKHEQNIGRGNILLLPTDLVQKIDQLWHHPIIQLAYKKRNEFQLNDSASYYFNSIQRIGDPRFTPTDQDILRSRVKTTGIIETKFKYENRNYILVDVGGQRSERKKWIHCFENVTAVIFMVAISEYNQVLFEDASINRLKESIDLFASICNTPWFTHTSFILLFNKTDLFQKKWSKADFQTYFPDYQGSNDYKDGYKYIENKFTKLKPSTNDTQLYSHFTCATDTEQIKFVFRAIMDVILQETMRDVGLL